LVDDDIMLKYRVLQYPESVIAIRGSNMLVPTCQVFNCSYDHDGNVLKAR